MMFFVPLFHRCARNGQRCTRNGPKPNETCCEGYVCLKDHYEGSQLKCKPERR